MRGLDTIALEHRPAEARIDHAVLLLFAPGHRPDVQTVRKLSRADGQFAGTLDGDEREEARVWLELLANGLAFDLSGLAPGKPSNQFIGCHFFGLDREFDPAACEAVVLRPGPHLTSGGMMVPILRCLAWVAAQLSHLPHLRAISWQAAHTVCAPDYFRDSVMQWIAGGAFPGLGLTALVPQPDGSIVSEGLTLFTGQELRLELAAGEDPSDGAKVALRLLHWLVENGKIESPQSLAGPSGETMILEPDLPRGIVRVRRGFR
jgi:hypothetical protein